MRVLVLLRSITKAPECGRKNAGGKLRAFQTIATLNGLESKSWDMHIVNALHLGERNQATTLLSDLINNNNLSRPKSFLNIFYVCARLPDPVFVLEAWRIMDENGIKIDRNCYILVIRSLCKGGYLEQAFDLMVNIRDERLDISQVLPVYNSFLRSCAEIHNVDYASKCLDLMEQRVVKKDEITYAEILKFAVLQQNLPAVHEIWIECNKFYDISIIALRKFIWSFSKLGDLKFAYEALQKMVLLVIQGKYILSVNSEGKLTNSRLDRPTFREIESSKETGEVDNLGKITPKVEFNNHVSCVLRWSFNDVIHACARAKNSILSEQLMLQMHNLGVEPTSGTCDGFIRSVLFERGLPDGLRVLKFMEEKNLKPHDSTYATLTVTCSKNFELELAEKFLDKISRPRHPHPYNAFLEACDAMDRPELGIRILAKMKKLNLKPDIRTYELLFSLFANVNMPYEDGDMLSQIDSAKRIKAIELDMMRNGIQHSYVSIRNLLRALGTEGMIKELLHYLHVAENLFSHTNTFVTTSIYNVVLHSLVEAREARLAIEMYKAMTSCGHKSDAATYDIMIDCCSIIGCFKSASAIVSVMIRNGYYPQVSTYTALIKILLVHGDFDEALNLMYQGCSDGIKLDIVLFNSIIQSAFDKKRLDVIEVVVAQMHRKRVPPDSTTCGLVFTAYVAAGYSATAMEALQVLTMRMLSLEDENTLQEKRELFEEDFILSEDSELVDMKLIKLFENSKEDLAFALMNLRWCAIVGFPISWSPHKSQWALRLSTTAA